MNISRNFKLEEFACPHCGETKIVDSFIHKLQYLRDLYNAPITITSGYRCKLHNKNVGGRPNSQHLTGNAADITGTDLEKLYTLAQKVFKAVGDGRSKGFIHVDARSDRVRRWTY